jgi:aryl-alcohol dehydrogenase-like predicted oxidoreductase
LKALADDLGISLAHLAIAWCLKNPNVSTVILGASKPEQLEHNLKATTAVPLLNEAVMLRIEEVLDNQPKQPPY